MQQQKQHVDALRAENSNDKGLIDLRSYENDSFSLFGYELSSVQDDIILARFL